jgi:hypothetical protein
MPDLSARTFARTYDTPHGQLLVRWAINDGRMLAVMAMWFGENTNVSLVSPLRSMAEAHELLNMTPEQAAACAENIAKIVADALAAAETKAPAMPSVPKHLVN